MLKIKINSKLAWIILGIWAIGVIYLIGKEFRLTQREIKDSSQKEADISESILRQIQQERVLYLIDKGNGNIDSYQIVPSPNSTVFSLLEKLAQRENFNIEFTFYEEMGVFIKSIDEAKNGQDNKYWQYWINDELPMVSADKKEVKEGDKVEWKFAPSPF
jgi:hypothetical protein